MSRRVEPDFDAALHQRGRALLRRAAPTTLQVNVGKRCNQACHHCHVEAGPTRREAMDRRTADRVLKLLERTPTLDTLDITGGAPELNPNFRHLVRGARALGRRVLDRCNLTVLFEPGQEETAEFQAESHVDLVASLPCTTKDKVEQQRGRGVFDKSIRALQLLNRLGYGQVGSSRRLDLVYNPLGPTLPPAQAELEERYRKELGAHFDIVFHRLLTLANMPIKRFAQDLLRTGRHDEYLSLLVNHFNPDTLPALMCRTLFSVGHDGQLYDCDFNQMLEIPLGQGARSVWDVDDFALLEGAPIATASHCFGCTAGAGSSCGGAIV